jgi:hypothetical protein
MTLTSRVIRTEVENLLAYLGRSEIALYTTAVGIEGGRVTWRPYRKEESFVEGWEAHTLLDYRRWLRAGDYSALLFDGSLLQITYDFAGRVLIAHRLAWIPCPFDIDAEWYQMDYPVDVLDVYAAGKPQDVLLKTPVRFDYDLYAAGIDHPTAHLSINSADCRIACVAPLRLGRFAQFIFGNFYPQIWRAHRYLRELPISPWGSDTVTPEEAMALHVSWRRESVPA